MNAPHKFDAPVAATREHELAVLCEDRNARHAANVKRMAKAAAEWAERPQSDYRKAAFLDAAAHCIDSDLAEETENTLRECGLDCEGFPLDSYGDRDLRADRVFFPVGDVG